MLTCSPAHLLTCSSSSGPQAYPVDDTQHAISPGPHHVDPGSGQAGPSSSSTPDGAHALADPLLRDPGDATVAAVSTAAESSADELLSQLVPMGRGAAPLLATQQQVRSCVCVCVFVCVCVIVWECGWMEVRACLSECSFLAAPQLRGPMAWLCMVPAHTHLHCAYIHPPTYTAPKSIHTPTPIHLHIYTCTRTHKYIFPSLAPL